MKHDGPTVLLAAAADAGARLDKFLAGRVPGLSRARLQALIRDGRVSTGGRTIEEANHRVKPGASYAVLLPEAEAAEPAGESISLPIIYEDEHVIVIDKPAGLVVHPSGGHRSGTLVNALIGHCGESLSGIGGVRRPGIVHRLDKDTSGLMVVAKNDAAHKGLARQFESHGVDGRLERAYLALVWGAPDRPRGTIDAPLGRKATNRTRVAVVSEGGRRAVTHFEVVRVLPSPRQPLASLLRCRLETGRTHQIRVHLAYAGHPVMGDPGYGAGFAASARKLSETARDSLAALGRQALHATLLGFQHPVLGKPMRFESPPPPDMARLLGELAAMTPS